MCILTDRPAKASRRPRECVELRLPSGRQTPIDGEYAHRSGDHGTYLAGRLFVHVTDDGEEPGGGE